MPSGKSKTSGSENGSVVYQPRLPLPDHRRVQALLDRRPDRERRREVVAVDDEVGAVADADQVDLGEELVGGVAGEHVREARLDADPDQREPPGLLPALGLRELGVAELHARLGVRERHRHVEVGAARVERGLEDRRVEARIDGVQDRVDSLGPGELGDRGSVGRVDGGAGEARIARSLRRGLRP